MTVRFPREADFDAWGISAAQTPSPPAGPGRDDARVGGRLAFEESLPGWVGTWRLRWNGVEYAWGIKGVNYDEAFRDIIRGVMRVASGHGAPD
jgi:hypothetical protein